jgi:uncharacterized protein (TIGR03067 family)
MSSTINTASVYAVGRAAAAGAISANVAALTKAVVKSMLLTKLNTTMSILLATALVAAALGVASQPEDNTDKKRPDLDNVAFQLEQTDRERIQGKWRVVACEIDGDKVATEDFAVVITGDRISVKEEGLTKEFSYSLSPRQKPKEIDWVPTFGVNKGKVLRGIYCLDGDKLVLCTKSGPQEANRPTEFKTTAGSQLSLMILERAEGRLKNERSTTLDAETRQLVKALQEALDKVHLPFVGLHPEHLQNGQLIVGGNDCKKCHTLKSSKKAEKTSWRVVSVAEDREGQKASSYLLIVLKRQGP